MITAFELQTYNEGKWKIDSIFDDKQLALFEAKRLAESGRFPGVRVVQESYDTERDKTDFRIIYKGAKTDEENTRAVRRERQVKSELAAQRKSATASTVAKKQAAVRNKKQAESNQWYIMLALKAGALGAVALIVLYGLHVLSKAM
jgi:hypothetical protein